MIRVKKMLDLLLRNDRLQWHITWFIRGGSIGIFKVLANMPRSVVPERPLSHFTVTKTKVYVQIRECSDFCCVSYRNKRQNKMCASMRMSREGDWVLLLPVSNER